MHYTVGTTGVQVNNGLITSEVLIGNDRATTVRSLDFLVWEPHGYNDPFLPDHL